jgi:hypothetical protein
MSVLESARQSRLEGLKAMRDVLAGAMDAAEPQVQAQLAAQLAKVMEQVEAIEQQRPEVSASDDIAGDLKVGLAKAAVVELAGRRRQPRAG